MAETQPVNPLRSEAEMFRVVVIAAAGAAAVIALAVLVAPLAGALLLAVEVAAAIALTVRGLRRTRRGAEEEGPGAPGGSSTPAEQP